MRPGLHAVDRSYAQYFINPFQGINGESPSDTGLNVSVEFQGGPGDGTGNGGLRVVVRPVSCSGGGGGGGGGGSGGGGARDDVVGSGANCSDYVVVLGADFAWWKAGSATAHCEGSGEQDCAFTVSPPGLPTQVLRVNPNGTVNYFNVTGFSAETGGHPSTASSGVLLPGAGAGLMHRFSDDGDVPSSAGGPGRSGPSSVCVTSYHEDGDCGAVEAVLAQNRLAEIKSLTDEFGTGHSATRLSSDGVPPVPLAETAGAVRAAVMWNSVFVPAEQGPVLPVDRSWAPG